MNVLVTLALATVLWSGNALAQMDWQQDEQPSSPREYRGTCPNSDCPEFHKFKEHRDMAREHAREFRFHRRMAREQMREFRNDGPAPMMPPEHQMRPPRFEHFQRPMHPFGPQYFGPPVPPGECPMGPPPHMRHRDGKHGPRAL